MYKQIRIFAADLETVVYEGQKETEAWSSALVELNTENVIVHHSLKETFEYVSKMPSDVVLYYHNLKFDGQFWLDMLMRTLIKEGYRMAISKPSDGDEPVVFKPKFKMRNKEFIVSISDMGQWYSLIIKTRNHYIELRDSLKLFPMPLSAVGKAFKTKHRKLEMEYTGKRYAGCEITPKEMAYIKNDVLVLKEALEFMFSAGHNKLTIGSCCLSEFKQILAESKKIIYSFKDLFPDLTEQKTPEWLTEYENCDDYVRAAYRGGWCYAVPEKTGRRLGSGFTADVNSLYPSMMHSSSGNRYPVGYGIFWSGEIPEKAKLESKYYYVRVRCNFFIKPGKLPFIQKKGSYMYAGNECLITSYFKKPDGSYTRYMEKDGKLIDSKMTITMSQTDLALFKKHYTVTEYEELDGVYFGSMIGIFDEYIDKWAEIKKKETGAMRNLAKLFLNNLYGKLASSTKSSFKVPYMKEDGNIGFKITDDDSKKAGHIASGAAVTSYSRSFTITAAQENYKPGECGFCYSDTDSIHCDIDPICAKGIKVHPTEFSCWKLESYWDKALFVRQKTYIEHITHDDGEPVKPRYNIKCAGMPDRSKELFCSALENKIKPYNKCLNYERAFWYDKRQMPVPRKMDDFKPGLSVPGKLRYKRIKGGAILEECEFTIKK